MCSCSPAQFYHLTAVRPKVKLPLSVSSSHKGYGDARVYLVSEDYIPMLRIEFVPEESMRANEILESKNGFKNRVEPLFDPFIKGIPITEPYLVGKIRFSDQNLEYQD
jgi:hypothetical protein